METHTESLQSMRVSPRQFYKLLNPATKKTLANELGISYSRLSSGYFNRSQEKRPQLSRARMEQVLTALNALGGKFEYADMVSHFYDKQKSNK